MKTMTLEELRNNTDWVTIFGGTAYPADNCQGITENPANPITRALAGRRYNIEDVLDVVAQSEGENDGSSWLGVFRMVDGRFLFVEAGCDYTGWDCQAGGSSEWCDTLPELVACIKDEYRSRLFPVPGGEG